MLLQRIKDRVSAFTVMFLLLSTFILVLTLVFAVSSYLAAHKILQEEIFRSNNEMISYVIENIEQTLSTIESSADQLAANSNVTSLISNRLRIDRYSTVTLVNSVSGVASAMVDTNPHIKGVRVYSIRNQMCVSEQGARFLTDADVDSVSALFESYSRKVWIEGGRQTTAPERPTDNIRLFYLIGNYYQQPGGILVVELDTASLFRNIFLRSSSPLSSVAILDAEGKVIISSNPEIPPALYAGMDRGKDSVQSFEGIDYLISNRHSDMTGWDYVIAVPERSVTGKIDYMRNRIILISAVALLIALAGSYLISKRLYTPIQQIGELLSEETGFQNLAGIPQISSKDEYKQINSKIQSILTELAAAHGRQEQMEKQNNRLQSSLDESEALLGQYFLYQVLMGDAVSQEDLRRRGEFLGFQYDRPCIAVLVEFSGSLHKYMESMTEKEQSLFLSGILEVLSNTLPEETEPMRTFFESPSDEAKIWAVIACPEHFETDGLVYKLKVSLGFFQNILMNRFEIESIIGIGTIGENLSKLFISGREAKEVIRYRFVFGYNTVISKGELTQGENSPINYYYYKKHLKKNLLSSSPQEISHLIRSHLEMLRDKGILITDYQYYCKDLINILCEFFAELGMRDSEAVRVLTDRFINFDSFFQSFEETAQWLSEYVQKVLSTRETASYSKIVAQALDIVETESNTDLSLSDLAGRLGVTTPYLSSLFKEEVGQNFKEYLTSVKLYKARRLLMTTEKTINEISEEVGYNNAKQFSAIFKKYVGVTPAAYRRDNRHQDSINTIRE